MPLVVGAACAGAAAAGRPQLARARLVQSLKWQRTVAREAGDERAAAAFASELAALQQSLDLEREAPRAIAVSALSDDEIHEILAARQAARLRRDFKSADRLRDQLNEQCVSVNDKTNRWDAADGRSGSIEPFTCDRKLLIFLAVPDVRPTCARRGSRTRSRGAFTTSAQRRALAV